MTVNTHPSKKILALGCSFTDKEYSPKKGPFANQSWWMWPELIGHNYKQEVLNIGRRGNNNVTIFHQLITKVTHHDDIDTVIMLSTEWCRRPNLNPVVTRFDKNNTLYQRSRAVPVDDSPLHTTHPSLLSKQDIKQRWWGDYYWYWHHHVTIEEEIHTFFRHLKAMQVFCKYHNKRFIVMQGLVPLPFTLFKMEPTKGNQLINNIADEYRFDTEDLIGFPFTQSWLHTANHKQILSNNMHPNAEGQRDIAKKFIEHIGKSL